MVTGMPLPGTTKDEIRQIIGQKLGAIAPPVTGDMVSAPFHPVLDENNAPLASAGVLQVRVAKPTQRRLYFTGGGAAYRRVEGGIKKLGGADLFLAIMEQAEMQKTHVQSPIASTFPRLHRRAETVRPLLKGRRVLWVDDNPQWNLYERMALSQLGVYVDVAQSTEEAMFCLRQFNPDLIISDMARGDNAEAGLELLAQITAQGVRLPVAFYVGEVDPRRGVPVGAIAIVDRSDEILHVTLDDLER